MSFDRRDPPFTFGPNVTRAIQKRTHEEHARRSWPHRIRAHYPRIAGALVRVAALIAFLVTSFAKRTENPEDPTAMDLFWLGVIIVIAIVWPFLPALGRIIAP